MTTISVLEGADVDLLGRSLWQKTKGATKKVAKVVKKSPIGITARAVSRTASTTTKFVAPVIRPVDKMLKSTPIVRTAYRSSISSGYMATGQFGKAKKSYFKTFSSAKKDLIPTAKLAVQNFVPGGSAITSIASNFKMPPIGTEASPRLVKQSAQAQEKFAENITSAIAQESLNPQATQEPQEKIKLSPMLLLIPLGIAFMLRKK